MYINLEAQKIWVEQREYLACAIFGDEAVVLVESPDPHDKTRWYWGLAQNFGQGYEFVNLVSEGAMKALKVLTPSPLDNRFVVEYLDQIDLLKI